MRENSDAWLKDYHRGFGFARAHCEGTHTPDSTTPRSQLALVANHQQDKAAIRVHDGSHVIKIFQLKLGVKALQWTVMVVRK